MFSKSTVAAVLAAQLVAATVAQAQQSAGNWKLLTPPNVAPTEVYSFPSYASLSSFTIFCRGAGSIGVKLTFRGPPQARVKVSGDVDARGILVAVGPGGVLSPNDAQNLFRVFLAVDNAARQMRDTQPGTPVVAEATVGDSTVNIDDLNKLSPAFDKQCENYLPGSAGRTMISDPRLFRSWIAPDRHFVVNFNSIGDWLTIEFASQQRASGKYKADGTTLWIADTRCGYRFDPYGNLVLSGCDWAGTWLSDANYNRGSLR